MPYIYFFLAENADIFKLESHSNRRIRSQMQSFLIEWLLDKNHVSEQIPYPMTNTEDSICSY
ncbi:hypothetical protein A584_23887 [Pseudomonas syringae pv. theae ICMP 3923]|nr:hypothetical protein A584_23887 [Pseudomonas syringae pv. theae ICMP 3923]KPZ34590.1 hypothetical protein AN901_205246 [Pseudomonas syringae pv. theae]MBL3832459.1 hypothetical protein [Pseudomonas syringae pv. theae]MBL3837317.1 hypothetical protein [Pseudomonas syringae pv. theae]MBL3868043.1 hypothetical protein [Pseudomonas syringae pv. theae]